MKVIKCLLVFAFLNLMVTYVYSQSSLSGVILDEMEDTKLEGATVSNKRTNDYVTSNEQGQYNIGCRFGDTIYVNLVGYREARYIVSNAGSISFKRNFYLQQKLNQMEEVLIESLSPYQRDSIERAKTYELDLARPWVSGVGAVFSPATALGQLVSKKAKQRRAFQKNFAQWELDRYSESVYTPELVAKIVPLTGDSLAYFMNAYPIAGDFARAATKLELKMWIKYNYLDWCEKKIIPKVDLIETK